MARIRSAAAINLRTAIKWAAITRREKAARAGIIEEHDTGDEEYMRYVPMREIRSIRQEHIKQLTDTALRSLEIVFGDAPRSAELNQPQE